MTLTAERLRELLDYNPATGTFAWRVTRGGPAESGDAAGTVARGYVFIKVDQRQYRAHRLAWLWVMGAWPEKGLDHIDGDGTNNRMENLRQADQSQNNANRRKKATPTSPIKGVYFDRDRGLFKARLKSKGVEHFLGRFRTAEEGHRAYMAAARAIHGEFACDGTRGPSL